MKNEAEMKSLRPMAENPVEMEIRLKKQS